MRRARFLLWLDVTLLLIFAFLEEPVTTGLWGHEWISIGFAGLLFLHLLVNWRWIAAALGRYRLAARRARVNTWLNGALYVTMVFTIFSGLVVSRYVLPTRHGPQYAARLDPASYHRCQCDAGDRRRACGAQLGLDYECRSPLALTASHHIPPIMARAS